MGHTAVAKFRPTETEETNVATPPPVFMAALDVRHPNAMTPKAVSAANLLAQASPSVPDRNECFSRLLLHR